MHRAMHRAGRFVGPLWLLAVLLTTVNASGQAKVTSTHITGLGQTAVPRFSTLYANTLVVPAEKTVVLPAEFDYDAIEVSGRLKLSRDYDTRGKFVVIQVLPGGSLDFGRPSDPVLRKVDLQMKDVPLLTGTDGDLGPDPEQFGNGILVFGEWVSHGRQLNKTWTSFHPVAAGATKLTLTEAVNWQVGDELLIPDTRQMNANPGWQAPPIGPRRESRVTIAAIDGNTLTLSKPLDFEHAAAAGQLPYVANCTRNIVVRSENPRGTRGHTMFMDTAHVNLYYTAFLDLGRTLPKRLDSYDAKTQHVGTNQIARYGGPHWHHVHGHADAQELTGRLVGCYGNGSDITKWFLVQHGTHDLLIADNVADQFVGGSFVTEDGFEVRGRYLRNFACGSRGNGTNGKFNLLNSGEPGTQHAPGAEGSGFWFHGSAHVVHSNVSINNSVGYQIMHMHQVTGRKIPLEPGGPANTKFDPAASLPLMFDTNLALSNLQAGFESWHQPTGWFATNFHSYHNGAVGALAGNGEPGGLHFRNSRFINSGGVGAGLHTSAAYSGHISFDGGEISGFAEGMHDVRSSFVVRNTIFRNARHNLKWDNFEHLTQPTLLENVTFERLTPKTQHIVLGQGGLGPGRYGDSWTGTGSQFRIVNWQGTGKNYFLFEDYAQRHRKAAPSDPEKNVLTCPEDGLTVGQCWDKYGVGPGGCAAPASSVALDGLVNAVAFEGDAVPPGPTRLVLMSPTALHPAEVKTGVVKFVFRKTGDQGPGGMYQIDNGAFRSVQRTDGPSGDYAEGFTAATPGTHTVKTYRADSRGMVKGSELTFTYYVGQRSPESPPKPGVQPTPGVEAVVQATENRPSIEAAAEPERRD